MFVFVLIRKAVILFKLFLLPSVAMNGGVNGAHPDTYQVYQVYRASVGALRRFDRVRCYFIVARCLNWAVWLGGRKGGVNGTHGFRFRATVFAVDMAHMLHLIH